MSTRLARRTWRRSSLGAVTAGAILTSLLVAGPAQAASSMSITSGPTAGGTEVSFTMDRIQEEVLSASGEAGFSALLADGTVVSWGNNELGQAGAGYLSTTPLTEPVAAIFPEGVKITKLAQTGLAAVALDSDGHLWSWGSNYGGYLGNGGSTGLKQSLPGPLDVPQDLVFKEIGAGGQSFFAITEDGDLYGWGNPKIGSATQVVSPVKITLPAGEKAVSVQAGGSFVVTSTASGRLFGWGTSGDGQLGVSTPTVSFPIEVVMSPAAPAGATWTGEYTVATYNLYAKASDGNWYARGYNAGQTNGSILGGPCSAFACSVDGVRVEAPAGVEFVRVGAGGALDSEGNVWTWGPGNNGRRGDGQTSGYNVMPAKINGVSDVKDLWIFPGSMIAKTADNGLVGWGYLDRQGFPSTSVPSPLAGFALGTISSVTFDGVTATLAGATTSTVTATAPAHSAGVVDVVVTWSDGATQTFVDGYTYGTAPVITTHPADVEIDAGSAASFTAAASGDEAPTVQWQRKTSTGSWTDVSGATSTTLNVASADAFTGDSYRAVFSNGLGSVDTNAATLTVRSSLIANDDTFTVPASSSSTLDVLSNDEGTGLTLASLTSPTGGGTATIVGNEVSFTPAAGTNSDSFTYTVTDSANNTATAEVTITVQAAPKGTDLAITTTRDTPVTANLSSKVSGVGVTYAAPARAAHGTVALTTAGVLTYTPDAGYVGLDSVQVTLTDDLNQTATLTVSVSVNDAAPDPDDKKPGPNPGKPGPTPDPNGPRDGGAVQPGDGLAATGASIIGVSTLAALLLAAGVFLLVRKRRSDTNDETSGQ
ncbi:hypothetical protein G7067_03555 [Leucobacter insecticola]|uniref:Ig-like domain-containing protein n=1 Tax=Leucobacter insecticola TaxID=2714934 RepID=A0A6G8FI34_9MICO|nr:Ig-like domain-containing protein [Leucobacter insecticola]QIM15702.1 hypothetical protein G7067_03555 [Leucobacter insecticola]